MDDRSALKPGSPGPLGAHWDGAGVNFAVRAGYAERVELSVFDACGACETGRFSLPGRSTDIFHGYLEAAGPGLVYGYRATSAVGATGPDRLDRHVLLLDPYARALCLAGDGFDGRFPGSAKRPPGVDGHGIRDSAPYTLKCCVTAVARERSAGLLCTPWEDSMLYWLDVGKFGWGYPELPARLRGTLAALGEAPVVARFRHLGVTAVVLAPLSTYIEGVGGSDGVWDSGPSLPMAIHRPFLASGDPREFARAVERLHAAGIEVIQGLVLGYPSAGNAALSLMPGRQGSHGVLAEQSIAAMRYWASEMGVDGFHLSFARSLGLSDGDRMHAGGALLDAIAGDAALCRLKLLVDSAAPGDAVLPREPFVGVNRRFGEVVRRFWCGAADMVGELATRLAGSSDLWVPARQGPLSRINRLPRPGHCPPAVDGGGEAACGGPALQNVAQHAADAAVASRHAMLATLLLSLGVPMLQAGDEFSFPPAGGDGADADALSGAEGGAGWQERDCDPQGDLSWLVRAAAALRRGMPLYRRGVFLHGRPPSPGAACKDVAWLDPQGRELADGDWRDPGRRALAILLSDATPAHEGLHLYAALNADARPQMFRLPGLAPGGEWVRVLDSSEPPPSPAGMRYAPGDLIAVDARSLVALRPLLQARDAARDAAQDAAQDVAQAGALAEGRASAASSRRVPQRVARCWLPPGLAAPPGRWAISVQVYSLRWRSGWGMGDFAALARFAELAAARGAAGVLMSPVHALSLARPHCASPYSPSSRLMLNPLFISVPCAAGAAPPAAYRDFVGSRAFCQELERLEAAPMIDYAAVARIKLAALGLLYEAFARDHLGSATTALGAGFLRFQEQEGEDLRHYALFEAISESIDRGQGEHVPWSGWPAELRDPGSRAVEAFAREHARRLSFFMYLQWLARTQLADAARRARRAGMEIGLIADLALGADLDSAEAWQWQDLVATDMELGAPPDALAPKGQCWGAPPWRPDVLARRGYAPYEAVLRAAMRDAGGVRLDHVLGLVRQFWVPRGCPPEQGSYHPQPFHALLQRVSTASLAHRCLVIGEDLGTVPEGLREQLASARILGYRVVFFERDGADRLIPPHAYPSLSAAVVSTHDLPTIAGFRSEADIDERIARALYPSDAAAAESRVERQRVLGAFEAALAAYGGGADTAQMTDGLHRFIAASNSRLVIAQIEDVIGMRRQVNLPGLADLAPNWRQRLPVSVEALGEDPRMFRLSEIFRARS